MINTKKLYVHGISNDLSIKNKSSIPLKYIKFFSTHNSYVNKLQILGEITDKNVKQYLKYINKFPICIELDIDSSSDICNEIIIDHYSFNNNIKLCKILNYIKTQLLQFKSFYPLVLNVDISNIKKKHHKITGNNIMNCFINIFKNKCNNCNKIKTRCNITSNTIKIRTINDKLEVLNNNTPLSELMNTVLIRMNNYSNIKKTNYSIMHNPVNIKLSASQKHNNVLRVYPNMIYSLLNYNSEELVNLHYEGFLTNTDQHTDYKYINMLSFNWHEIKFKKKMELINAFIVFYKNYPNGIYNHYKKGKSTIKKGKSTIKKGNV